MKNWVFIEKDAVILSTNNKIFRFKNVKTVFFIRAALNFFKLPSGHGRLNIDPYQVQRHLSGALNQFVHP